MQNSHQTWYVLEDGAVVDPSEVAPDTSGKLVHKGGVAVAMRGQVPHTRGVYPDQERAKAGDPSRQGRAGAKPKDMKPAEQKAGYVTRESKAE